MNTNTSFYWQAKFQEEISKAQLDGYNLVSRDDEKLVAHMEKEEWNCKRPFIGPKRWRIIRKNCHATLVKIHIHFNGQEIEIQRLP